VFEANAELLSVRLLSLPSSAVATAPAQLGVDLASLFREQQFEVPAGSPDLLRNNDGVRERWDIEAMAWVSAS